jgi:hypothetical protein
MELAHAGSSNEARIHQVLLEPIQDRLLQGHATNP